LRAHSFGYHQSLVRRSEDLITHFSSMSNEQNLAHKAKEWPNSSSKYFMFYNLF
jgi:hypothetical protein